MDSFWMIEVLSDLEKYAEQLEYRETFQHLMDTKMVAVSEIRKSEQSFCMPTTQTDTISN